MQRIHLICNAHLDPYWQWEWEEGAAEAISTFRTAADLCEEFDGFVFNHNEVILYRWVEEYEPPLFERIQRLVKEGKWHIMGGWYLQPDCNMPSGESFVRQILLGKTYFMEKFGVEPTTANNFDPFGHTRGLAQILAKSGYDSYLFCRPQQVDCPLPADDFTWVGYDGSQVTAFRASAFYNSRLGKAREKVEQYMADHADKEVGLVLWGVGNHGGGPSRKDLERLADLMRSNADAHIAHSIPERYFEDVRQSSEPLPEHADDINPWGVGCYTSMIRVKQKHRQLENEIFTLEKMAANAHMQGLMAYPKEELLEAQRDLAVAQFHDILPGSSIQPVEEAALRLLYHGLELTSRAKARAFFALTSGQPKPLDGDIPIFAYNPHPFPVKGVFHCEFQLPDAIWTEQFTVPTVTRDGKAIPSQCEKEYSNLNLDWRKRAVFEAELAPGQVTRFGTSFEVLPERPKPLLEPEDNVLRFETPDITVHINCLTGYVDKFAVAGDDLLSSGAFMPIVVKDNEDPWGMTVKSYRDEAGAFSIMPAEKSAQFSGVNRDALDAVRVIEDGPVRAVVETALQYGDSFILQTFRLPKKGTEVEVEVRVQWNEKDHALKWSVPTTLAGATCLGDTAYGTEVLVSGGQENVSQKWVAVLDEDKGRAVTVANDGVYGSDFVDGELRMTLLRAPAYCAHPIHDRPVVPQDRFTPRIDQGERIFKFWVNAGPATERMESIPREALARNEAPFVLSFFPSGQGELPLPGVRLSDDVTQMGAFKLAEDGQGYILRLFEPTGEARRVTVSIPAIGLEETVPLGGFEIASYRVDPESATLTPVDLIERPL